MSNIHRARSGRALLLVPCLAGLAVQLTGAPPPQRSGGSPQPVVSAATRPAGPDRTVLDVADSRFMVNGRPTFLLGISYYGALGAPEASIRADLTELQRRRFNWVRVWATWGAFSNEVSAVGPEGQPRPPFIEKLKWLVGEADARGLVLDVTLSRGNGTTGPMRLQTLGAHRQAVESVVRILKPFRNWYLDLSNERNIRDARFASFEDLESLRARVRELDPERLVTASHAGDLTREDVRQYVQRVRVDFLSPHRPRGPGSSAQTAMKTAEYLAWMKEQGRSVPVHYQEPFRRGFGQWEPGVEDFVTDALGARQSGAAGWCFHNGAQRDAPEGRPRRSFDLRAGRLFEQLDVLERRALDELERSLHSP